MKTNKILVLVAAIIVFILMSPLGTEWIGRSPYLAIVRYLLAFAIAIPTAIYSIRKYRKTTSRFYIFPCFTVALGFWVASMFFMQKRLPDSINSLEPALAVGHSEEILLGGELTANREGYFYLTHYYNEEESFFSEGARSKADSILFSVN